MLVATFRLRCAELSPVRPLLRHASAHRPLSGRRLSFTRACASPAMCECAVERGSRIRTLDARGFKHHAPPNFSLQLMRGLLQGPAA